MSWIEENEWNRIQKMIPIICVDILPIKKSPEGEVTGVGLILRRTPHEGQQWCTVGGRLLYGESIQTGVVRQLKDTLGEAIHPKSKLETQPLYIAQYYPSAELHEEFDAVDPRKHAVALTYCFELVGPIQPQNEAIDFIWFTIADVLAEQNIGFHQDKVIRTCLERLSVRPLTP